MDSTLGILLICNIYVSYSNHIDRVNQHVEIYQLHFLMSKNYIFATFTSYLLHVCYFIFITCLLFHIYCIFISYLLHVCYFILITCLLLHIYYMFVTLYLLHVCYFIFITCLLFYIHYMFVNSYLLQYVEIHQLHFLMSKNYILATFTSYLSHVCYFIFITCLLLYIYYMFVTFTIYLSIYLSSYNAKYKCHEEEEAKML